MVDNEFLKSLPMEPGVYIMKNKDDEIIYVGKAKKLRNRVNQYFVANSGHTAKVRAMVNNVEHIDYIVTNSEPEALNLECSLIKKHKPKYNILLKDDKTYPYIKVTSETFPRIEIVRKAENDNSSYYGPYTSSYAAKGTVNILKKTFGIRDCKKNIQENSKDKPCLNSHIGICSSPCNGSITVDEYKNRIEEVKCILNGNIHSLVAELTSRMKYEASQMNFECAAELRDKIGNIKKINQSQIVVSADSVDEDFVYLCREDGNICIQMLFVRNGKVIDKKSSFLRNVSEETDESILYAFLLQYYTSFSIPRYIYISADLQDVEVVSEFLSGIKGKKVYIRKPVRGDKNKLMQMAAKNAGESVRIKELYKKENNAAVEQLKEYLKLVFLPNRIEAYDISNTAGSETVASMVVFKNGLSSRKDYRKFKIKDSAKSDDYGAMYEVISRRFTRAKNKDDKFAELPDIIFVDGGVGQIKSALRALSECGFNIPVFGIVKDDKHKTRDIISENDMFNVPIGTKCFKLAVNIQDEMHRCAITYHRNLRNKRNYNSELRKVDGVGDKTYKLLLNHFRTIENIKNADLEELKSVKGITAPTAKNIFNFFQKKT